MRKTPQPRPKVRATPRETATDPCLSKPCYNYGTCIQQDQNSYSCACNASYGGLGCKQNLVGACASNPCQRDGICVPIGLNGN